jgi:Leucine-rich repeat (LRR) protein
MIYRLNTETFHQCACIRIGPNDVNIECREKQWFTIPALDNLFNPDEQTSMSVNKLGFIHGALNFIKQDAFKTQQQIQILDLGNNNIQNVNVNAFRGLESTLKSLSLQGNELDLIPLWSLTFLQNLQYLRLQDNQIRTVDGNTTSETKLHQLQYMHLDRNKVPCLEHNF